MSSNKSISTVTTASASTAAGRNPKKIFMYVSSSTSEVHLRSLLAKYGQVNYVHIPTNESGQSKGMVFAGFRWHEDAAAAIEGLNGSFLNSMVLHPHWATPRKKPTGPQKSKRSGSRQTPKA
jgi:RNA recognition motif-containing protein